MGLPHTKDLVVNSVEIRHLTRLINSDDGGGERRVTKMQIQDVDDEWFKGKEGRLEACGFERMQ